MTIDLFTQCHVQGSVCRVTDTVGKHTAQQATHPLPGNCQSILSTQTGNQQMGAFLS